MSPHKRVIDECQNRVAQELKNYQAEIYQINQSLQQLKAMVLALNKKQDDHMAKVQAMYKASEILNEHFTEHVKDEVKECKDVLDDYRDEIKSVGALAREAIDQSFNYLDRTTFHDYQDNIDLSLKDKDKQIDKVRDAVVGMCTTYGNLERYCNAKMNRVEDQIPDLQPLSNSFETKLQEVSVNFAGLVKEIEICKKRISYGDKKFENLYTLIERLKVKNESSR